MKLSRIATAIMALSMPLAAASVSANQSLVSPGYSGSVGGASSRGSVHTSAFNPASTNVLIRANQRFRMGYMANIGGYLELGSVKDLDVKLDELVDDLDALDMLDNWDDQNETNKQFVRDRLGGGDCDPDDNATLGSCYQVVADNVNELIPELAKGGQIRAGGQVSLPLVPFLFRTQPDWAMAVNAGMHVQTQGRFVADDFGVKTSFIARPTSGGASVSTASVNTASTGGISLGSLTIPSNKIGIAYILIQDMIDDYDNGVYATEDAFLDALADALVDEGILEDAADVQFLKDAAVQFQAGGDYEGYELVNEAELTTDSAFDVKAAFLTQVSVNYAHNLTRALSLNSTYGTLEAGARVNIYQAEMFRNLVSFQGMTGDDDDDDAFDRITEDFKEFSTKQSAVGLDVGLLWHAKNYQVGATIYNLNEPSFDYPDLSRFLEGEDLDAANNLQQKGALKLAETVKLTRHMVLEGAYFTEDGHWALHGYYTLGTATNLVGDEFQNMGMSGTYLSGSWLIPSARLGYNKNLVGTELSTINVGATFFGVMNLDLAYGLEKSSFDGNEIPRYYAFNLGFEQKF